MPHYTRRSPQKSSINPIQAKFSPLPVQQPKAQNKADKTLPEVKPGGVRAVSPLQRLIDSQTIQAKLTIGEPNDQYEQEADAVAKDVVQRINAPVSEEAPQETVQRETRKEKEDELQMKPSVQRVQAVGGGEASTELESSLNRAKAGGQSLDAGLQQSMGEAMNAYFSGVRVHTDSNADQLNQSIQAKAFTTGQDVFFKKGEYQPGNKGGQELIAHELTHVVQQNGGEMRRQDDPQEPRPNHFNLNLKSESLKSTKAIHAKAVHPFIQRYTILESTGYDNWGVNAEQMFPSQHLDTTITNTLEKSVSPTGYSRQLNPKTTVKAKWNQVFKDQPPLKVSDNSNLALEHSEDQPKAFYATPEMVTASNKRLEDIGSRILLSQNTSDTLEIPADMANPDNGETEDVSMVTPIKAPHIPVGEKLMDTNECNNVANKIVGGAVMVVGKEANNTSQILGDFDFSNSGSRITTALHNLNNGDDTQDLKNEFDNTPNFVRPNNIAGAIQTRFQTLITANKVHTTVLKWLSLPNLPAYVITQVYNTYNQASALTDVNEQNIVDYIQTQAQLQGMENYEDDKQNKQQLIQDLAINENVSPEVGEAFSTVGSGKEMRIMDDKGVMTGMMDMNSLDTVRQGYALMVLKNAGNQLNILRAQYFDDVRKAAHFQEHHAAVVAKDGNDTITFENYNRTVERKFLYEKQWNALAEKFKFFADEISNDIDTITNDNSKDALNKYMSIRMKKVLQLNQLNDNLGTLYSNTYIAFQKNSYTEFNDWWFFSMYGTQAGQSFHEKWAESHDNPVTIRTSANINQGKVANFKQEIVNKLQLKGLDLNSLNVSNTEIPNLYNNLLNASTQVEASKMYRRALEIIESL